MGPIRVALAGFPHLLGEILHAAMAGQPDLSPVVASLADLDELRQDELVNQVVVVDVPDGCMPPACHRLLERRSGIPVLVVCGDGRRLVRYDGMHAAAQLHLPAIDTLLREVRLAASLASPSVS